MNSELVWFTAGGVAAGADGTVGLTAGAGGKAGGSSGNVLKSGIGGNPAIFLVEDSISAKVGAPGALVGANGSGTLGTAASASLTASWLG